MNPDPPVTSTLSPLIRGVLTLWRREARGLLRAGPPDPPVRRVFVIRVATNAAARKKTLDAATNIALRLLRLAHGSAPPQPPWRAEEGD
jgi:hypothetical protein